MIEVKDLSFTYPGGKEPVLQNVNFTIGKGEIFGFLGPSGAGKSTTQKIIYRLLRGFTGSISIDNKPLEKWGLEYYQHIGVGFELPNHYKKLSGRENMMLFGSFYKSFDPKKLPGLFTSVGLEEAFDQPVETYSKGMQVRLNFIRALIHDPEIYFFDEPASGLDPMHARKIREIILGLKERGKTVFITTHNMLTADEICDRVAFLVDGRINTVDSPERLKHEHGKDMVMVRRRNGEEKDFPLKNIGANEDFLSYLKEEDPFQVFTEDATLEDVFIKLTGKSLSS